jgi:hypothetical protein
MRARALLVLLGLGLFAACGEDGSGISSGGPDGPGGDGGAGGGEGGSQLPAYVDFDINHVLITGQSNSVSNGGEPELTKAQRFDNLMFDTGIMSMTDCDPEGCKTLQSPTSFVPLVEGDNYYSFKVETCANGLADEISLLAAQLSLLSPQKKEHVVLASLHGRSGNTYQCLRKGGCNYKEGYVLAFEQGMKEVETAKKLADARNKSYVVRAVAAIHGESDHYSYTSGTQEFPFDGTDGTEGAIKDYSDGVVEWQRDYETEVKKITGQTLPVPLFISQISGWNDAITSKVAQYQLDAHVKAPGKVFLVGPAYALPMASDCLHYSNEGERRLGEYFAKVYARVIFEGQSWEPVRPKSITRAGKVITVVFHVPKPPLVIDTKQVAEVDAYGFTYEGGDIASVALAGPDTVKITLASEPSGKQHLRYAMNQVPGTCIATPEGARGNIRDSDDTPSNNGYPLQNWAVHFDLEVD